MKILTLLACSILMAALNINAQEFFNALNNGDKIKIKKLVDESPHILNSRDGKGFSPLHLAVKDSNHAVLELLLELGADIFMKMPDSTTALRYAVIHNDPLSAEMLFLSDKNKDIEFKEGNEVYKLGVDAIKGKFYSIAELLVWPMHYIVKRDRVEYFSHLVSVDKNLLKSRDMRKMTPLHIAYLYDNERFINLLRSAGARDTIDAFKKKPQDYVLDKFKTMTEVNTLEEKTRARLDDKMLDFLEHHNWLTLGVIKDGKIVYLRSFGSKNMIDKDAVYASVSKPLTSIIFLRLLRQGIIKSLDDPISDYSKKYRDVMPNEYANEKITFRHILTHRSGIPHINKELWVKGKLNLLFKPGTKFEYSTNGFSVLGEVMTEATGKNFSDLVKEYIGQPINANSFWAEDAFRAPAARIHSTTRDFARFAEAIINNRYLPKTEFDDLLIGKSPDESLGWGASKIGTDDLVIGHSGSNGKPRAHFLIKPNKKLAVVMMGETKDAKSDIWFLNLAPILMDILENKGNY